MVLLPMPDRNLAQHTSDTRPRPVRLLTVVDGSGRTGPVMEVALSFARRGIPIEVIILGVISDPPDGRLRGYGSFKRKEIHERLRDVMGARTVAAAARRFEQAGVTHKARIEVGPPAETILRVAAEEACDIVLLGN